MQIDTPDVTQFGLATASLKFESYDGGRDSKERLTQGLMVALEVTILLVIYTQHTLPCVQVASPGTLIVVFTDNGSKDLFLEKEVIKLRERKQCEVYIVLTPAYEGKITGKSLPAYGRMGQVKLKYNARSFSVMNTILGFPHQRGGL